MTRPGRAATAGLIILGLGLLLTGCGSPAHIRFQPVASPSRPPDPQGKIIVRLQPLSDERPQQQRDSLWQVAGRRIQAEDLVHWLNSNLARVSGKHFLVITPAPGEEPAEWTLTPKLRHAYASHLGSTKSAQIVIEFELHSAAHGTTSRLIRGRRTNMNWASTESEINGSMQAALQDCLTKIGHELDLLLAPSKTVLPN